MNTIEETFVPVGQINSYRFTLQSVRKLSAGTIGRPDDWTPRDSGKHSLEELETEKLWRRREAILRRAQDAITNGVETLRAETGASGGTVNGQLIAV